MVNEFPFGTSQSGKRDYVFRISVCPGNFPVGRTKISFTIYILTGISGNFVVNGKQPLLPTPPHPMARGTAMWKTSALQRLISENLGDFSQHKFRGTVPFSNVSCFSSTSVWSNRDNKSHNRRLQRATFQAGWLVWKRTQQSRRFHLFCRVSLNACSTWWYLGKRRSNDTLCEVLRFLRCTPAPYNFRLPKGDIKGSAWRTDLFSYQFFETL